MEHEGFMRKAIELGRHGAFVEGAGGPFGAVVVHAGEVIGEGFNRVIAGRDPTRHGEMEAIRQACAKLGTHILEGCVLYSSAECCPMCAAAAWWARIDAVYYASTIEDALIYGGFDDFEIYEELRRPVAERKLPTQQICRDEAVEVWKEFQALPGRAHY